MLLKLVANNRRQYGRGVFYVVVIVVVVVRNTENAYDTVNITSKVISEIVVWLRELQQRARCMSDARNVHVCCRRYLVAAVV